MFITTLAGYVLNVFLSLCLLFIGLFGSITVGDLDSDYINSAEACRRLNWLIIPELVTASLGAFFLIVSGSFVSALLLVLYLGACVWRLSQKRAGNTNLYDAQDIFNHNEMARLRREYGVRLGAGLVYFLYFLFRMVSQIVSGYTKGGGGTAGAHA